MNTNIVRLLIHNGFSETKPLVWTHTSGQHTIVADFRSQRPQWYGDKKMFPWYKQLQYRIGWEMLEIQASRVTDWRDLIPEPWEFDAGLIEQGGSE
jgi:hypothetical protein